MKSQRGVRLPTAPPTRKHGDENRYRRNREKAQNWHDYLDATLVDLLEETEMEMWEAQERLDEIAEQRADREKVDDDYADDLARADDDGMAIEKSASEIQKEYYDYMEEVYDGEEVERPKEEEVSD